MGISNTGLFCSFFRGSTRETHDSFLLPHYPWWEFDLENYSPARGPALLDFFFFLLFTCWNPSCSVVWLTGFFSCLEWGDCFGQFPWNAPCHGRFCTWKFWCFHNPDFSPIGIHPDPRWFCLVRSHQHPILHTMWCRCTLDSYEDWPVLTSSEKQLWNCPLNWNWTGFGAVPKNQKIVTWVCFREGRERAPALPTLPACGYSKGDVSQCLLLWGSQGDAVVNAPLTKWDAPTPPFDQSPIFWGKMSKKQRKIKWS